MEGDAAMFSVRLFQRHSRLPELWPIVETSVKSENDGTTVRQTVAHTIQLLPHGLGTPRGSRLSRRNALLSVLCLSQAAGIVTLAHTTQ